MPTLSIYVNDAVYSMILDKAKTLNISPSGVGKQWIEERYIKESGLK